MGSNGEPYNGSSCYDDIDSDDADDEVLLRKTKNVDDRCVNRDSNNEELDKWNSHSNNGHRSSGLLAKYLLRWQASYYLKQGIMSKFAKKMWQEVDRELKKFFF